MTQEELNIRLKDSNNILNRINDLVDVKTDIKDVKGSVVKDYTNRSGPKGLSDEVKTSIGVSSHFFPQKDVAKLFGVSQALVSDYSKGLTSSSEGGNFDVGLKSSVDKEVLTVRARVNDLALSKLTKALESMTDEMFVNEKLVNLSVIAGNLGKLSKVGISDELITNNTANQFVFYAPRNKNEDEYEIVEVSS